MVILGGMGNVWGVDLRRARFLGTSNGGPRRTSAPGSTTDLGMHIDVPKYAVRDLRRDHRGRDALPAPGPDPERARASASSQRRRPRRAALRRRARADDRRRTCSSTRALRKEFGGLVAVDDVDFTIPRGSIVSLIGPNGAGKTTFFNMLTGVYKPTAGRVLFDGEDVTGKPPHAITERGIGRTFQNIRLFQNMTALENVLVGMHCRLKGGIVRQRSSRTPRVRREEAEAARARARAARRSAASAARRTSSRGTSPTATSAGSRSRARSRRSRSCCCSTSRRPA